MTDITIDNKINNIIIRVFNKLMTIANTTLDKQLQANKLTVYEDTP